MNKWSVPSHPPKKKKEKKLIDLLIKYFVDKYSLIIDV